MIVGIDLGTKWIGVVVARDALPLHVLTASTIEVGPGDAYYLGDAVRGLADRSGARDVVVEFGSLYIPADASPQKARAIAENHAEMGRMLDRIHEACKGPWYRVTTIARRSWSCRVVPGVKGGISDAEANAGLAAHVDPACEWWRLADERGRLDQHRADACGAVAGHLLGAPRKAMARTRAKTRRERREDARRPRRTPEQKAARKALALAKARQAARLRRGPEVAERLARACTCGPDGGLKAGRKGRHKRTCPCAPAPTVRGSKEAAAAYVPMTRPAHPLVAAARQAEARPDDGARHAEWAARLAEEFGPK